MGAAVAKAAALNPALEVAVSNPSPAKLETLKKSCPFLFTTPDNTVAAAQADIIILAVKPYKLKEVIDELGDVLTSTNAALVSLAGGVSLDALTAMLPSGHTLPLARVIPDTAIAVGQSMTFITCRDCNPNIENSLKELFDQCGKTAFIEEKLMDAATAISSCGIAYYYKFIQASVQAGVQLGLRPADALAYSVATMRGAAAMLEVPGATVQAEIDRVTTPGGMTIKGINELDHCGFTSAVISAILKPVAK